MNIFKRAAMSIIKNELSDYIQKFISGEDLPGEIHAGVIDTKSAMKYSAVFACNRVLSETLAATPIMEYRKLPNGEREKTSDTAAFNVLHNKPNDEMSPFGFKESSMTAINLGGNAVSQRLYNRLGELVGLYPFEWQRVRIERSKSTGKLIYIVKDGASSIEIERSNVFHIPGPSYNGVVGMTPLEYISGSITLGKMYEDFGIGFYENGANAGGAFTHPGSLSDASFERLKNQLKKEYVGIKRTGKPMLLEDGVQFQPFTIKPADAQLIENKRFQIEDICRIYRVPLHLVQDLSHSTNNNIEHQSLEFIMYTMLPHFKRWEENINSQLLTDEERAAGYYLEFNMSGLLRGDSKSRAESYAIGRNNGWLSVNDIRRLENMNSIGLDGDIYLQPLNMIDVSIARESQSTQAMLEEIYKIINEGR